MSFIKGLPEDENDRTVAAAVISLGQKLKLRVIAEGVETAEQADCLRRNSCDEIQGAKPPAFQVAPHRFKATGGTSPRCAGRPRPRLRRRHGSRLVRDPHQISPQIVNSRRALKQPLELPASSDLGGGQEGVPFPSARVQFSMSPCHPTEASGRSLLRPADVHYGRSGPPKISPMRSLQRSASKAASATTEQTRSWPRSSLRACQELTALTSEATEGAIV